MSLRTLGYVLSHPLTRGRPFAALRRIVRWQLGSRLLDAPVAMPFVGATRLLVARGMHGATGNVYAGLHEFEDMAFVMHALRPGDLFVDVGANVGAYTVIAAGAAGAAVVAFEPSPQAFPALLDNVRLNGLEALVEARNEAVGDAAGELRFSVGLDTVNHVLAADDGRGADGITVPVTSLDHALRDREATVLKLDVEGFETAVLRGANAVLRHRSLLAIVVELNGSGARYGFDEQALARAIAAAGFVPCHYEPRTRELSPRAAAGHEGNTLFVRDVALVATRLRTATPSRILGRAL